MFVPEEEELSRVMREIADALQGRGAALTLHPGDGLPERVIYTDVDAGIPHAVVDHLLATGSLRPDPGRPDEHRWISFDHDGRRGETLALPVQPVPGHSRLIVSVYFDELDAQRRIRAETVYHSRRPFAVGYFRLWQIERANARHISATEASLDLMSLGVILLASSGRIVFANDAARGLLNDGEALRERKGHLVGNTLAETVRLQTAISHVVQGSQGPDPLRSSPIFAMPRAGKMPLIVSVLPTASPPEEPGDTAARLFVVDPMMDVDTLLTAVCKVFQLTNVETGLACLLASGSTITDAAAALKLKDATARTYLKQIFLKTGTNRQAELVRVLLSSLVRTQPRLPLQVI